MDILQKYLTLSEAGFSLTLLIQLGVMSVFGLLAVKTVSRQSAPLRSLFSLTVMASLALVLAVSTAFHFSNVSWCKTEKTVVARELGVPSSATVVSAAQEVNTSNIPATNHESMPHESTFEINWGKVSMGVGAIWLIGSAVALLKLLYGLVFLNGFKYGLTSVDDPHFNTILKTVAARLEKNKIPKLHTSPRVESPITIGISNPIVIIPERLLGKLNDNEMKSILLHELAHIYNRDHLAGIFKRIIIAANWWNPLVYIISAEHSAAREEVSDNHVLLELRPRAYSECLAGLAEKTCLINRFPAAAGMAGKHSRLEQRVKNILSKNRKLIMKTAKRVKTATVLACIVAVVSVAGMQYASAQPQKKDSETIKSGNLNISEKAFTVYLEFLRKCAKQGKISAPDKETLKKSGITENEWQQFGKVLAFYQMSRNSRAFKYPDDCKPTPETKALLDKYGSEISKIIDKLRVIETDRSNIVNLKQIGMALLSYAHDHDGKLPGSLADLVKSKFASINIFQYPSSRTPVTIELLEQNKADYVYLGNGQELKEIKIPSATPIVITRPGLLKNNRTIALYADGHVADGATKANKNVHNETAMKGPKPFFGLMDGSGTTTIDLSENEIKTYLKIMPLLHDGKTSPQLLVKEFGFKNSREMDMLIVKVIKAFSRYSLENGTLTNPKALSSIKNIRISSKTKSLLKKYENVNRMPPKAVPESSRLTEAVKKEFTFGFERATSGKLVFKCGINRSRINLAVNVYGKRENASDKWDAIAPFISRAYLPGSVRISGGAFLDSLPEGKHRFKFKFVPSLKVAMASKTHLVSYYGGTVETDWLTLNVPSKPKRDSRHAQLIHNAKADRFKVSGEKMILSGNAYIPYGKFTVYANNAIVDYKNKDINASGNVRLHAFDEKLKKSNIFKAKSVTGNLASGYFKFTDFIGNRGNSTVKAKSCTLTPDGKITVETGSQKNPDAINKVSDVYVVIEPKLGRIRLNNTVPNTKLADATLRTSDGGFFKVSDISVKNKDANREFTFKLVYNLKKKPGQLNQTIAVKYSELPKKCLQAGKWSIWVKRGNQLK